MVCVGVRVLMRVFTSLCWKNDTLIEGISRASTSLYYNYYMPFSILVSLLSYILIIIL